MRIRTSWRPSFSAASSTASRRRPIQGPPIVRNGHEQSPATLPSDWRAAIDAAERSALLRTALGDSFLYSYIAIKRQEWDKFNARVSEADYEWYLETV